MNEYKAEQNIDRSAAGGTSRLAAFLRFAGAGAVVLSALLYMLQGIDNVDMNIRHWIYLLLMAAMAVGGYVSRIHFSDAKGARLFFALAVLLIPVQFSQLGGMIYQLAMIETSQLSGFWKFDQVSFTQTLVSVGVSVALAIPVAYVGFAILARYKTARLVAVFLALNAMLLPPFRISAAGIAILASMLALLVTLRYRFYRDQPLFTTGEGLALKTIVTLPFAVALARLAFHASGLSGTCAILIIAAYCLTYLMPVWLRTDRFNEVCLAAGAALAGCGWLALSDEYFFITGSATGLVVSLLPLIAVLFEARRRTKRHHRLYRNFASGLSLALGGLLAIVDFSYTGAGVSLGLGVAMAAWGVTRREKTPLLAGVALSLGSIVSLLVLSLAQVSMNIWLVLAIAGVMLVLVSSVIEKHGRMILDHAQRFRALS